MLKTNKKGFTLIELIVVMAVIAILVLLATPKFLNYTKDAKLTQIINDVKVTEGILEAYLIKNNDALPPNGTSIAIDEIKAEVPNNKVFNNSGLVSNESDIIGNSFEILDKDFVKKETMTNLEGDYIASEDGKVYYIHTDVINNDTGSNNEPWVDRAVSSDLSIATDDELGLVAFSAIIKAMGIEADIENTKALYEKYLADGNNISNEDLANLLLGNVVDVTRVNSIKDWFQGLGATEGENIIEGQTTFQIGNIDIYTKYNHYNNENSLSLRLIVNGKEITSIGGWTYGGGISIWRVKDISVASITDTSMKIKVNTEYETKLGTLLEMERSFTYTYENINEKPITNIIKTNTGEGFKYNIKPNSSIITNTPPTTPHINYAPLSTDTNAKLTKSGLEYSGTINTYIDSLTKGDVENILQLINNTSFDELTNPSKPPVIDNENNKIYWS